MPRKNNLKGAGSGRPQGSKNKISTDVAEAFKNAFDDLGGTEALTAWAKDPQNRATFYRMTTKLLPKPESVVNVGVGINQGMTASEYQAYLVSDEYLRNKKEHDIDARLRMIKVSEDCARDHRVRMMRLRASGFIGSLSIYNGEQEWEEGWADGKYSDEFLEKHRDEWEQIVKEEEAKKKDLPDS